MVASLLAGTSGAPSLQMPLESLDGTTPKYPTGQQKKALVPSIRYMLQVLLAQTGVLLTMVPQLSSVSQKKSKTC
jgi:hypothetical protein